MIIRDYIIEQYLNSNYNYWWIVLKSNYVLKGYK